MIRKIIFTLLLTSIAINCNGQFKRKKMEKIRAYKIAFLTEKLDLTSSEAEKFWPIYNVYNKKMIQLRVKERMSSRKKIKEIGGLDELSETEAKDIIEKMKSISEERYNTKTVFLDKIKSILSYKKILQLKIAEHEFDRKLFRKFRNGKK